jgi:hypothetical protein
MSTALHPIKVTTTAPSETTRADEIDTAPSETMIANKIAIKKAKTRKVSAVVAVMSIFRKKECNSRSTNSGNGTLLAGRQKMPISQRIILANWEAFLQK